MKKYILSFVFLAFGFLCSCKPAAQQTKVNPSASSQDGLSIENAVVIKANSDAEGVSLEWEWINSHYPDRVSSVRKPIKIDDDDEIVSFAHLTQFINNKVYSIHYISLPDGSDRAIYFDMTDCFYKNPIMSQSGTNPNPGKAD